MGDHDAVHLASVELNRLGSLAGQFGRHPEPLAATYVDGYLLHLRFEHGVGEGRGLDFVGVAVDEAVEVLAFLDDDALADEGE